MEVYAEGQIRVSGTSNADQTAYRGVFRTSEVQLKCYDRAGPKTEKDPPWDLAIIRRSGFVAQKPAGGPQAGARGSQRERNSWCEPRPGLVPSSANVTSTGLSVATPAAVANSQPVSEGEVAAPTAAESPPASEPKRDSMVERAQYTIAPLPPHLRRRIAPSDPQIEQTQARSTQVPGGVPQPPDIDLPPIEGKPEVQVPKLPTNPEDLPPNIEPLPAWMVDLRARASPDGAAEGGNELLERAGIPVVPFIGGHRPPASSRVAGDSCRSSSQPPPTASSHTSAVGASISSPSRPSPGRSISRPTRP